MAADEAIRGDAGRWWFRLFHVPWLSLVLLALLAAVVLTLSRGGTMEEALRLGVASGTACVLTPGTELCHRREVDVLHPRVKVQRIEPQPVPAQEA